MSRTVFGAIGRGLGWAWGLAALSLAGCCRFCPTPDPPKPQPQRVFTCEHEHIAGLQRCVAADPARPGSCFNILETDATLSPLDRAMLRGCVLGMVAGK